MKSVKKRIQRIEKALLRIHSSQKTYLNVKEAAEYLGISEKDIVQLIIKREISCYKANGNYFFTYGDIQNWIFLSVRILSDWDQDVHDEFLAMEKQKMERKRNKSN